jgi:hypothetical protein
VPDPSTGAAHNFPLDEVTVFYRLNGGALVQVGTIKYPADVVTWFSRMAKAGILVSSAGSTTPITATFAKFSITAPWLLGSVRGPGRAVSVPGLCLSCGTVEPVRTRTVCLPASSPATSGRPRPAAPHWRV